MNNPLSKLTLDYWYKVLIVAGAFVFLLNGTGVLSAYPPGPTALVSLGVFFGALVSGLTTPTRKCSSTTTSVGLQQPFLVTRETPSESESCFDILAFVLIAIGVWKFF